MERKRRLEEEMERQREILQDWRRKWRDGEKGYKIGGKKWRERLEYWRKNGEKK